MGLNLNCTSTASPDRPKRKPPDRTLAHIDQSKHNLTIGHRSVILVTNRTAGVGDSSVTPAMQFYLTIVRFTREIASLHAN